MLSKAPQKATSQNAQSDAKMIPPITPFYKYFQIHGKYTKIQVNHKAIVRQIDSEEKKILGKRKKFWEEKFLRGSESEFYM